MSDPVLDAIEALERAKVLAERGAVMIKVNYAIAMLRKLQPYGMGPDHVTYLVLPEPERTDG